MNDAITRMIELKDAIKLDNHYFLIIGRYFEGKCYTLKFGILEADYSKLRYILTYRPFENTGVGAYKYFFTLSYQKNGESAGISIITVRVEQLKQHKNFQFPMGNKCISNLLWFHELKDVETMKQFIFN